jgi:transcriptional regulator with XRE-family HTH domain
MTVGYVWKKLPTLDQFQELWNNKGMKKFKERLQELRKSENLTQETLASKLSVNNSTVSSWECGKSEPKFDMLIQLAILFDVTTDYILGLSEI